MAGYHLGNRRGVKDALLVIAPAVYAVVPAHHHATKALERVASAKWSDTVVQYPAPCRRHHRSAIREYLVPGEGFEPPTFGLQNRPRPVFHSFRPLALYY